MKAENENGKLACVPESHGKVENGDGKLICVPESHGKAENGNGKSASVPKSHGKAENRNGKPTNKPILIISLKVGNFLMVTSIAVTSKISKRFRNYGDQRGEIRV